jgi:hypothetical protein
VALIRGLIGLLVALVLTLPSCRCSDQEVIARLIAFDGAVHRDWADRLEQWEAAEVGNRFGIGDGVRSGEKSTAQLTLQGNAKLNLTPKTLVRFLKDAAPGHLGLDVAVGSASVETSDQQLKITSSIGAVVIEPGTQMRMSKSQRGLRFEISVGRARLETGDAKTTELKAGQGIEIAVGGAVIEQFELDAGAASVAGKADAEAKDGTPDEQKEIVAHTVGDGATMRVGGGNWQKLAPGSRKLDPGTGVRVKGEDTTVTVQRGKQQVTLREGEFVVGLPGGYLVQAVQGPVRLSSGGRASVSVPGGVIIARGADTSADVQVGGKRGTSVRVHLGEVEVRGRATSVLQAGEGGVLSKSGELTVSGRGPGRADLAVGAGETFTVHDPRPPTVVGFRLQGGCPNGAVVVVGGQQWAARAGQANVPMRVGRHSYQQRCLGVDGPVTEASAKGTVVVVKDAGTRPIAGRAPTTHVDTDGRRYTVLYQNRLPTISVGWANAPEAPSYALHVDSRSIRTVGPNYSFGSGTLQQGTHTVRFEAATVPPRRSRRTTISIQFDNATPMASLDPVPDAQFNEGSTVSIAGRALPGWKVSVGGKELELDGQSRFRGSTKLADGHSSVPVKFQHPSRGTHYYLRRPSK